MLFRFITRERALMHSAPLAAIISQSPLLLAPVADGNQVPTHTHHRPGTLGLWVLSPRGRKAIEILRSTALCGGAPRFVNNYETRRTHFWTQMGWRMGEKDDVRAIGTKGNQIGSCPGSGSLAGKRPKEGEPSVERFISFPPSFALL